MCIWVENWCDQYAIHPISKRKEISDLRRGLEEWHGIILVKSKHFVEWLNIDFLHSNILLRIILSNDIAFWIKIFQIELFEFISKNIWSMQHLFCFQLYIVCLHNVCKLSMDSTPFEINPSLLTNIFKFETKFLKENFEKNHVFSNIFGTIWQCYFHALTRCFNFI